MNPTLEVQITAKLDKLDAGLKVAEAKVNQSAQTMGKVGEKAGANFGAAFAANLPMMMVATAIAHTVGKGVLEAVKGANAGKSGEEIGLGLAQGIVDGAKSLPVVGVVVSILDEMINGMDRLAEAAHDRAAAVANSFRQAFSDIAKSSETTLQAVIRKTQDISAKGDPAQQAKLNTQRTIEEAKAGLKQIEDEKKMLRDKAASTEAEANKAAILDRDKSLVYTMQSSTEATNQKEVDDVLAARVRDAASTRLAAEQSINKIKVKNVEALNEQILVAEQAGAEDQKQMQQEKLAKFAEMQKTASDKKAAEAQKAADVETQIAKKQKKDEFDAAMQAQQDIIDANKEAQAQIDKIGRVDQMAGQAAQGMISSGQTALGQFNFAQAGAGGTALDMAKKQVASLEKIDAATAQMVQLTRENKGFQ